MCTSGLFETTLLTALVFVDGDDEPDERHEEGGDAGDEESVESGFVFWLFDDDWFGGFG